MSTNLEGMDLFDVDGTGVLELQKEDDSGVYESDEAAWQDFMEILSTRGGYYPNEITRGIAVKLLENWRPYAAAAARAKKPPTPQIVIVCDGGLVQSVVSNVPCDVITIDYDHNCDPNVDIPQDDGTTAKGLIFGQEVEVNETATTKLFAIHDEAVLAEGVRRIKPAASAA